MKNLQTLMVLGLVVLLLPSCAKVFYSPDAEALAKKQQVIAIIPPKVSIDASKEIEADALKEQQRTESLNFQKEIHSWMLKRKMQGKINKEIQDIDDTNTKLERAGFPEKSLTTTEMCEILGVDGIMTSNFALSKPLSEGAAVAVGIFAGTWGPTNEVQVTLSIKDCSKNKLIWNYEHKSSGSVGSSPSKLVDQLMRKASRKMPYSN